MEYLQGVRCINNTDSYSKIELITDKNKYIINLKYELKELEQSYKNKFTYRYPISIKQYCKEHNIKYRDYFRIIHNDCD